MQVGLFSGEVNRTWRFVDRTGGAHEVSLYHHPLTGARAAMVDHDEVPGSLGTSSVFHASTSIPFVAGPSSGYITILRTGVSSFRYGCVADGQTLPEATTASGPGPLHASQTQSPYRARVVEYATTRDHAAPTTPIAWYVVATYEAATGREATRVHRRFRDFVELDESVQAALAGHHMRESMPHLPSKKLKLVQDHLDTSFLKQRAAELDSYLRKLLDVPHVWDTPPCAPFLGVARNAREYSIVFSGRTLGFTLGKCGPKKTPEAGDATYEPPDFPAFVASTGDDALACPSHLKIGDLVSKISGRSTCGARFQTLVAALRDSARPIVVHFIGGQKAHVPGAPTTKTIPTVVATKPPGPSFGGSKTRDVVSDEEKRAPSTGASVPSRPAPLPPTGVVPDRPAPLPPAPFDDGSDNVFADDTATL